MIRSSLRAAAAAFLVVIALAGCSPDSRPLARVGKHTITIADFNHTARRSTQLLQMPGDQAKPLLLEDLVRNQLLLGAAESHGRDTSSYMRSRRRAAEEQALLAALSTQLAPANAGVSEGEIRQLYEWRKTESNVQIVYAPDSSAIELARSRIAGGDRMSEIADQFGGSGMIPVGGLIGWRPPGTFPVPLDEAARTLPVGTLGGPYHAAAGWFLIRVAGRRPVADVRPYEMVRTELESMIRQRKWQTTLFAAVGNLAPQFHLTLANDAGQRLFRILTPGRVGGMGEPGPDAAERTQVLARWDGGVYTVNDAWTDLARPEINKPVSSIVPSLSDWVRQRAIANIAVAEARRRHLDQEPEVMATVDDQLREVMLRAEYQDIVANVAAPDEASLRAQWETVKTRFPMLRDAQVQWLATNDTAAVMAIGQHASQGTLRDVAHQVDPSLVVHEEVLHFPTSDPRWANAQGELQQMQPGQWANPAFTPDGIRVLQLVDKSQGVMDWDQLPGEIQQSLANNFTERSRDARLGAYVDSLRRMVAPVMLTDVLKRVPWPPAPEPAH